VTVVDDGHVRATVPAGSGTVDVRVQSGVADPGDTSDYTSPVFGYGTSAITPADSFTYGGGGTNQPPTVAQPAAASPATVTGTTTALSVLGADDGGEANLTYTWAMTSGPAGASPAFSANGTNAAKNTTVTFNRAGSYVFQVTITDAGGLSTTSSTSVTVAQTLTSVTLTPSSATVAPAGKVQFTATAYDQFAVALAQQPTFTWKVVSGTGTVSSTGLYTAPNRSGVNATVQASAGGHKARATVQVRKPSQSPGGLTDL
jgi:hypothetical protein